MIWKAKPDIEMLQKLSADTMVEHIGIEFTEAGDNYLIAKCRWITAPCSPCACFTAARM